MRGGHAAPRELSFAGGGTRRDSKQQWQVCNSASYSMLRLLNISLAMSAQKCDQAAQFASSTQSTTPKKAPFATASAAFIAAMVWARRALAFCLAARSRALTTLPPLPALDAAVLQDSHGFSAEQNWLVPGRVMLGRYPGSGRGQRVDAVVDALRTAGVTTFVCLQSELPPQDSGAANPPGFENYHAAAVNFDGPAPSFVHFGIPDREPAGDLDSLRSLVADLAARVLKNGECLFIHCWGGKGRTGLVAACLLGLLYESLGAEEALDRVQAYAETRTKSIVSPETDPQRDQVRAFFAAVRGGP